jgi:hypothetical protein
LHARQRAFPHRQINLCAISLWPRRLVTSRPRRLPRRHIAAIRKRRPNLLSSRQDSAAR